MQDTSTLARLSQIKGQDGFAEIAPAMYKNNYKRNLILAVAANYNNKVQTNTRLLLWFRRSSYLFDKLDYTGPESRFGAVILVSKFQKGNLVISFFWFIAYLYHNKYERFAFSCN